MPEGPEPMTATRLPVEACWSKGRGGLAPAACALRTWSPA